MGASQNSYTMDVDTILSDGATTYDTALGDGIGQVGGADAILDLKLRHLAKLEEEKIRAEQKELNKERRDLEKTLGSAQRLKTLIRKEIERDSQEYGDPRR